MQSAEYLIHYMYWLHAFATGKYFAHITGIPRIKLSAHFSIEGGI